MSKCFTLNCIFLGMVKNWNQIRRIRLIWYRISWKKKPLNSKKKKVHSILLWCSRINEIKSNVLILPWIFLWLVWLVSGAYSFCLVRLSVRGSKGLKTTSTNQSVCPCTSPSWHKLCKHYSSLIFLYVVPDIVRAATTKPINRQNNFICRLSRKKWKIKKIRIYMTKWEETQSDFSV